METSPSVTCTDAASRNDAIHTAAVAATSHVPTRVRRRTTKSDKQAKASGASVSPTSQQLHNFEALPEYLQDNEFIQSGYRYNLPVKDTLRSFFNLHNETGNIWSHFIGFVLFAGLTVWMVNKPPTPLILAKPHLEELWHAVSSNMQGLRGSMEQNYHQLHLPRLPNLQNLQDSWQSGVHSLSESVHSLQDRVQSSAHALADQWQQGLPALMLDRGLHWPSARWPMYVFCAGAMSCLLLSAGCHLFGCCKQHITTFIWRLDYAGIALLIVSSFYPTVYYSFLCQPYITLIYLVSITTLGAAAMMMSLLEVFQRPEWRHTRAGLYVALGLMGVVPLAHVMALHSDVWHVRTFVFRDVVMGASYIAGAAIYANRVPERWFPGKFDILLHSHQIFHVCVVLGAYLHWRACLLLLEWRDASGGCAVPVMKGPLSAVLDELSASGHDLLAIDQVWEGLRLAAAEHIAQLMASAGAAPPAGPAVA